MQEYQTESHRLSLMTRSQDEIKRLADQLEAMRQHCAAASSPVI